MAGRWRLPYRRRRYELEEGGSLTAIVASVRSRMVPGRWPHFATLGFETYMASLV